MLAEILSRFSSIPVTDVQDGMRIERDRIYGGLPGDDLEIEDDCLKLKAREAPTGQHRPIDHTSGCSQHIRDKNRSESCCRAPAPTARWESGDQGGRRHHLCPGRHGRADEHAAQRDRDRRGGLRARAGDIAAELGRISGHPYIAIVPEGAFEPPDITPVLDIIRDS